MKDAITVSQLNSYIKELVSNDRILRNVLVKGEVSNLKESKGNYYFSLKDDASSIQCIVFTRFSDIGVDTSVLTDGQEYLIEGKVAIYEKGGTYSIYVSKIVSIAPIGSTIPDSVPYQNAFGFDIPSAFKGIEIIAPSGKF